MLQSRFKMFVLVLTLGFVAAGIYLSIWAGVKAQKIEGPSLMREDDTGNIWVLSNRQIHTLDPEGQYKGSLPLTDLSIDKPLGDFLPHPSEDLIVAIMETQEIRRYNSKGDLKLSFAIKKVKPDQYYGSLKFALDPETQDYFVADTLNHQIVRFDRQGQPMGEWGQKGSMSHQLHFPNRISFGADGLLYGWLKRRR